jgi:gluconolactonase
MKRYLVIGAMALAACHSPNKSTDQKSTVEKKYAEKGKIEVMDPAMLKYVAQDTKVEILAEGFKWSEGPLWIENGKYLLFSDIPPNKVMKWSEKDGLTEYLHPAGYTGTVPREGEPGSNGLILDNQGRLVMCHHGDRRMARMEAPLDKPVSKFVTLADKYEGKRFNSPNDAVYHSSGDLYFTDPPYGLVKNMDDPAKELSYQGVFRAKKDGTVELLYKELSRPNGIAFSRDEKKLYVANSDVNRIWMVFDVRADGGIENGKIFYDASSIDRPGSPDGMKVHSSGNIFTTGPGGVLVLSPEGKLLGRIDVADVCSNVAFDTKEEYLYITANSRLVRVKLVNGQ